MDSNNTQTLRKRINKIFDNHVVTDNTAMLNTISALCADTSTNTKRVLANEIEKRDIFVNKNILAEYKKVRTKLHATLNSISILNNSVRDMAHRINDSKTQTHHLINQTAKLKESSQKTEKKNIWVNAFVSNFQLPSDKSECLYTVSIKSPLTLEFIDTLTHIEKLYYNCKCLVKCGYQTTAFDLMETIGLQQEVAIEKLYHWTISACRNIESPNFTLVPKAMNKFQGRLVLFTNILDEYCTARKTIIVQKFIDALTKVTGNDCKPIEFYADDINRYVSDMLAWVYKVLPVEKDNLNNLFKYCDVINCEEQVTEGLIKITEAICPLLKVRVELTFKPDKDPLVLCAVTNLIIHYNDLIRPIIPNGHLIDTFELLYQKSEENFAQALNNKVQKELTHGVKAPPSDLNTSVVVTDLVCFLRDLLATMNVSQKMELSKKKLVITHILDPMLHAINETACHLSSTDMSVYLLNCIYHIQCTLSLYTVMDDFNERLQAQSEAQIDTLTSEQASYLVANLNLGPIYTILQEKNNGPLNCIPGMDAHSLKKILNKFDMFLVSPDSYLLPQLNLLLSHTHKVSIKSRAFEVILAIYDQLYKAITEPTNGYTNPENILRRSPIEVKSLLK